MSTVQATRAGLIMGEGAVCSYHRIIVTHISLHHIRDRNKG